MKKRGPYKIKKSKKIQLTETISVRFRADKLKCLAKFADSENLSMTELHRKILLDFIDRYDL